MVGRDQLCHQNHPIAGDFDTIGSFPCRLIDTIKSTIFSTSGCIWTEFLVPFVSGIAVGGFTRLVGPSPVTVHGYSSFLLLTSRGCASFIGQVQGEFLSESSLLLSMNMGYQYGNANQRNFTEHRSNLLRNWNYKETSGQSQ